MIKRVLIMVVLVMVSIITTSYGQRVAVKTNILYGGYTLTPNIGVELRLSDRYTFDVSGGYNWFNLEGTATNNKKLVHWLVQPEARYWLCEAFNGHYFGAHLLGSKYNISTHNLPLLFGKNSDKYRFEGWAAGAGLSYGYQLPLAKHWNIDFSLGLGYAYMRYDKYLCPKCGDKIETGTSKHYFGPTKASISLVYIIK